MSDNRELLFRTVHAPLKPAGHVISKARCKLRTHHSATIVPEKLPGICRHVDKEHIYYKHIYESMDSLFSMPSRRRLHQSKSMAIPRTESIHFKVTAMSVKEYLSRRPDVLEYYVINKKTLSDLEAWVDRKKRFSSDRIAATLSFSDYSRYMQTDVKKLLVQLSEAVVNGSEVLPLWYEVSRVVGRSLLSDFTNLYKVENNTLLQRYIPDTNLNTFVLIPFDEARSGSTLSAFSVHTKKTVVTADHLEDERFPKGTGIVPVDIVRPALAVPIVLPSGEVFGVLEFSRRFERSSFTNTDIETATAQVCWTAISLHESQACKIVNKQVQINKFLLGFTEKLFQDVVYLDPLVERIMIYAKELVNADRCAFFRIDHVKKELFSNTLDKGKKNNKGEQIFEKSSEIRFSIKYGIAGHVARTGEVVNIPVAYDDPRFNREIDIKTGYKTKNILCMPIISDTVVIGVVQMINKVGDEKCFTKSDENSFQIFSVYCALALHYSSILEDLRVERAKGHIAQEQVNYKLKPDETKLAQLVEDVGKHSRKDKRHWITPKMMHFQYYAPGNHDPDRTMSTLYVRMTEDILGNNRFNRTALCMLVLTIIKAYRDVPHHNIFSVWDTSQFMYAFLKRTINHQIFPPIRKQALLIAALVHDVDHRGYNNCFYEKTTHSLAALYDVSLLENHHYNQFLIILNLEGNNIFMDHCHKDYKQALDWIREAIMATDRTLIPDRHAKLSRAVLTRDTEDVLNNRRLQPDVISHLVVCMDMSYALKPWGVHRTIVDNIYAELIAQGDEEKRMGHYVTGIMDNSKRYLRPIVHAHFLENVVLPQMDLLEKLFTEFGEEREFTRPVQENLKKWSLRQQQVVCPLHPEKVKLVIDLKSTNIIDDVQRSSAALCSVETYINCDDF